MEEKRFTLRMNGELFEEVSELANIHRRSVAKEIEYALAKYLKEYRTHEIVRAYEDSNDPKPSGESQFAKIMEIEKKYKVFE